VESHAETEPFLEGGWLVVDYSTGPAIEHRVAALVPDAHSLVAREDMAEPARRLDRRLPRESARPDPVRRHHRLPRGRAERDHVAGCERGHAKLHRPDLEDRLHGSVRRIDEGHPTLTTDEGHRYDLPIYSGYKELLGPAGLVRPRACTVAKVHSGQHRADIAGARVIEVPSRGIALEQQQVAVSTNRRLAIGTGTRKLGECLACATLNHRKPCWRAV